MFIPGSTENILLNGAGGVGGSYAYSRVNKKGKPVDEPVYGGVMGSSMGLSPEYKINKEQYLGSAPPKLSDKQKAKGLVWANTGSEEYQRSDHKSGSVRGRIPTWTLINSGAGKQARAEPGKTQPAPATGSTAQAPYQPSSQLNQAREQLNQARERLAAYTASSNTPTGSTAGGGSCGLNPDGGTPLYCNIYNDGQANVDKFSESSFEASRAKTNLGIAEAKDAASYYLRSMAGQAAPKITDPFEDGTYKRIVRDQKKAMNWSSA